MALSSKMEKQVKLSHILKPIYFVLFMGLLEMVNFLWLHFTVTGSPDQLQVLPKYFFLDIGVYLIAAGVMFVARRGWANTIMYIFLGFQAGINMINATLFKVFGDIFSFDMMKLGGEAAAAFRFEFIDLWSVVLNLAILGVIITIQVLLDRKLKVEIKLSDVGRRAVLLSAFFCSWIVGIIAYGAQTCVFYDTDSSVRVSESDQYLWDNMHFKLEAYKKFGTYGFYLKSLANLIYKKDDYDANKEADLLFALEEGQKHVDVTAPLYGDNCIILMLESFEWFAIDPFNTPTLWEIRTSTGVSMENFYGKNKTNVSEDISLLGNMPKDISMGYLARADLLSTPWTLPNLFKSQGYSANFFHSYKKTFYQRNLINEAMGFDHVYGIEDADLENKSLSFNDWNLDSDYVSAMMDKFIPENEHFFTFMTTVTTHGSYARDNERFDEYYDTYDANLAEYKAWLAANTSYVYPTDDKLESYYRQYKCAAMDTDRMVRLILDELRERGLDKNTSLVMFADHNCYYEDIYFNIKGTRKEHYYNIYNYNIPFMIWSQKLAPEIKTEFCNTYDVYPTICDLFGLPSNSAMTHGYSVFSPEISNSLMVSYLTGAFNSSFYTLNIVDMHTIFSATQAELVRFKRNACKFYESQIDIELVYKHALYLL